ncbi:unnamed protein product [Nyctereutes procyonoides]|uniref:(raccoon dog) hypothetical protein n=1 Tax=Nyctereutes procyonoides TaxID=34880 RepID=A0A811YBT7_NYCPR|nr:unnamed protein product [Nyctereutes procyonoides]
MFRLVRKEAKRKRLNSVPKELTANRWQNSDSEPDRMSEKPVSTSFPGLRTASSPLKIITPMTG